MVVYICPRCHYETTYKNNMRNHYTRRRLCKTVFARTSIKDCLKDLESKRMKTSEILEKMKKDNEDNLKRVEEEYKKRLKVVLHRFLGPKHKRKAIPSEYRALLEYFQAYRFTNLPN